MGRSILLDRKIKVLVASAGGVGTTFLQREIGKFRHTNCPNNSDGFKHLPIPPIALRPGVKAIYVYGDPITAVTSLFRRGYQHTQSVVTQHFYASKGYVTSEETLDEYASSGIKRIFFARHFHAWRETPTTYSILFLHYEAIHRELETIRSFLELPPAFVTGFPLRRKRASQPDQLPRETVIRLERMYGDWAREVAAMPAVLHKRGRPARIHWNHAYRRAYGHELGRRLPLFRRLLHYFRSKIKKS